jgi:hypothetical protein
MITLKHFNLATRTLIFHVNCALNCLGNFFSVFEHILYHFFITVYKSILNQYPILFRQNVTKYEFISFNLAA